MSGAVQLAWLTGSEEQNRELVALLEGLRPGLPVVTVSEFPVGLARWIPYHPKQTRRDNLATIRLQLEGLPIGSACLLIAPRVPFWKLRAIAFAVSGTRLEVYDEHLAQRSAVLQGLRLVKAWARWHSRRESPVGRWLLRVRHPQQAVVPLAAALARLSGRLRRTSAQQLSAPSRPLPRGIAVIIPSRNGAELLRTCLPLIAAQQPAQIIVVENGTEGVGGSQSWPGAEVVVSAEPLSFARAINLGVARVRVSHVLLLNNDMLVEPDFLASLSSAFEKVPGLFCATAQILFPEGQRREETGKAVMRHQERSTEFPVRCEVPKPGEDGTWVFYGSGGCSLFDVALLRALGGLNEALEPAYVEDLDLGYRAWQRGWPSVFCAAALVEHRHRSTTARYWTPAELDTMVQINYLTFLASAVSSPLLFRSLWNAAIRRLHLAGQQQALLAAVSLPLKHRGPAISTLDEAAILALTNGDVSLYPGQARRNKPLILIATPYLPFPLSHGGAVRIFNLMRAGRDEYDWLLTSFTDNDAPPPAELLNLCTHICLVRRTGSHYRVSSTRPDMVEEFDSPTFHAVLRRAMRQWNPSLVQLEWTHMAQYAGDCTPAKTILVEHDITVDLYEQMERQSPKDYQIRTQRERWLRFESAAWRAVDGVVTMSERDRERVSRANARTIPNGVDTERYQPSLEVPHGNRLLFIGSFAHHPNRSAVEWFLKEVWPLLLHLSPTLHIIAGPNPPALQIPGVTIEGFVPDVRPAYREAAAVIAPLVTSAGTNIKILEAMAMGKPVVSTTPGIHGLDVEGVDVADTPEAFAAACRAHLTGPGRVNAAARACVEKRYSWKSIAERQAALYRDLMNSPPDANHETGW